MKKQLIFIFLLYICTEQKFVRDTPLGTVVEQFKKIDNSLIETQPPIYAICLLAQDANSGVSGTVKILQTGSITKIKATVTGLSAGKHGFHVHQYGNLSGGCASAGSHFNILKKDHGAQTDFVRHTGDLSNLIAEDGKDAQFYIEDKQVTLRGENSILGRAFVVHKDEDDLGRGQQTDSKTTGHAGARLACCTIGISDVFDF